MKDDLNALAVFAHVARLGTFTAAARSLQMPKATVSDMVSDLERRLGTRLLERTTRRVTLTETGRVYLASCERVLAEIEQGRNAVESLGASPRGLLRLSAPFALSRGVLGVLLPEFRARYPDVRVVLDVNNRPPGMLEDDIDVALRIGRADEAATSSVSRLTVFMTRLYASADYLESRTAPSHPSELSAHALLGRADRSGRVRWSLRRDGEVIDIDAPARLSVNDPDTNAVLIRRSIGIGWLPEFLATEAGQPPLVRCLPDWDPEPVELHAVLPSARSGSPKASAFVEFLRDALGPVR